MRGPRMGRGPGNGPGPIQKAKDFKGTIKTIISRLGFFKIHILFVMIFAISSTIFSIVGPKILGSATTEIYIGVMNKLQGSGGINFAKVIQILVGLIVLYLVSALFSFLQGFIMSTVSQKFTYNMREDISKKIHRLPMNYFDKVQHGEILSRVTNDIDTLNATLSQSITQIITSITTFIGIFIMMLSISWLMTLVALVTLPVTMAFVSLIVKVSQKYFKQQQSSLGVVNGQIEEVFSGHIVVKAFNNEKNETKTFNKSNQKLHESAWKSQFLSGIMMPVMILIENLSYIISAVLGGYLAFNNIITVGNIQAFIQYTKNFHQPIHQLAQISNQLQSMAAAAERIFEFLDEREEQIELENPTRINDLKGIVSFKNVKFGYNPDKIIINDFCCTVDNGKKVAIVGPTGAGKTTIVKLLMRFYDLNSGSIEIDGIDITDIDRNELRGLFGMVLQDTWLFNGTIMDNIRYGNLNATDEQVIAAAKAAHVHHFIKTLSKGYNTELNEETTNLSQGQKQLLTIARAILANPRILILDEATSSVDTRTEVKIQKAMDTLTEGRTSFVIAHRLSTIRDADVILVMKDGDIVEQGTHDELLASKGFYSELYNSQFTEGEAI